MMNRIGLKLAILITPFITLVAALSLLPEAPVVYAQEPTPEITCVTGTNVTIHPSAFLGVDVPSGIDVIDPGNMLGPADGVYGRIGDYGNYLGAGDYYTCAFFDLPGIVSTVNEGDLITITTRYTRGVYQENLFSYPTNGQTSSNPTHNLFDDGWDGREGWYWSTTVPQTGTIGTLGLCAYNANISGGWGYNDVDAITVTLQGGQYCYENPILYTCPHPE